MLFFKYVSIHEALCFVFRELYKQNFSSVYHILSSHAAYKTISILEKLYLYNL